MENVFNLSPIDGLYTILLCVLVGIEVIRNVPAILHTPLMSGSNAISGIIIIGGVIQLLENDLGLNFTTIISCFGVLIGTINVSGGFFVTHRMLKMFKSSKN
jgi:H+-translocating NAD(P) transhydrogenase subunit alpha